MQFNRRGFAFFSPQPMMSRVVARVHFLFAVSRFKKKMAVEKRLAFSVVQFLRDQIHCAALNSDEQESLEGGSAPPASVLHSYLNTSVTLVGLFVCLFVYPPRPLPAVASGDTVSGDDL